MGKLISGSTLRRGGSGEFIDLAGAMPQLPPSDSTSTGFTLVTDGLLRTSYKSSIGYVEFTASSMYSAFPDGVVRILATGTTFLSTGTGSGSLVVEGGVGIGGNMYVKEDIVVNGITVGQGYAGVNNLVIRGEATPLVDNGDNGQEAIAIGYDTLLGIDSAYKSIAIGRNALSTGTKLSYSVAIGDQALQNIGTVQFVKVGDVTDVTLTNPVVVTAVGHNLTTGSHVTFVEIDGTIELNNNDYYVDWLSADTVALYQDNIVTIPVDGTGFTAYVTSGTIGLTVLRDRNIAIGADAARSLIDGEENFFFGNEIAKNLTTGSYNIFIGSNVANNMTRGSGIISFGGDNLVDGVDNQINIGSVYYFNGARDSTFNSNVEAGLGDEVVCETFVGTLTNATNDTEAVITLVDHGLLIGDRVSITNVSGMPEINNLYWVNPTSSDEFKIYTDSALTLPVDSTLFGVYVSDGDIGLVNPTGALTVVGGLGVQKSVCIGGDLHVYGQIVSNNADASNTATNLAGGDVGSIPYQVSTGTTSMLPIGLIDQVLISDGTSVYWGYPGALSAGTATFAENVFINPVDPATTYYLAVTDAIGDFEPLRSDTSFTYDTTDNLLTVNKTQILSTASSTSTTASQSLLVAGGVGIAGSIYAKDGNPDQGNLLYTPRVTVSNTTPTDPRVGDFWIYPDIAAELQYIKDGTNFIWVQIASI